MIPAGEFARSLEYVRRTGVHTELEELLRPDGKGGRPRAIAVDVLLAAMMLTYTHSGSLLLVDVHKTLTAELSRSVQERHGIRPRGGAAVTVRQVRYPWNAIANKLDASVDIRPELEQPERDVRNARLQDYIDRLVASASLHLAPAPGYAADLTAVDSPARARARRVVKARRERPKPAPSADRAKPARSADRDARFGYRTETFDNRTEVVFGYQLLALARVGKPDTCGAEPLLFDRIAVVPANQNGVPETIAALDSLDAEGRKPAEVITDRGFSYAKPKYWAALLADRGIKQVLDMHSGDRGGRLHPTDGYLMVDGWPHCPQMPNDLKTIKRPARLSVGSRPEPKKGQSAAAYVVTLKQWTADKKQLDDARDAIARRAVYRFEIHGKTSSGARRFTCPARAGKVACDGCPLYAGGAPRDIPTVKAPDPAPHACTQRTITVSDDVTRKLRQDTYWMSDEWIASFSRRSRVEGGFGILKKTANGGIKRGWTRQVTRVRTAFLLALAVAASNLDQLISWARASGDHSDPLTAMDVTDHGFEEYDQHGHLPANAPPGAAP